MGGDDILRGGTGDDTFDGGTGDDFIDGGGGNDVFVASTGNDIIRVGSGLDVFDVGSGLLGGTIDLASGDLVLSSIMLFRVSNCYLQRSCFRPLDEIQFFESGVVLPEP